MIAHIDHEAGDEVALGQRVMVLAKKGEDPKAVAAGLADGRRRQRRRESEARRRASGGPQAVASTSPVSDNGRQAESTADRRAGGRVRSSPLARKIAAEAKVDIGRLAGSGPGGRVVRKDVEAFLAGGAGAGGGGGSRAVGVAEPRVKTLAPAARISTAPLADERIPNSRMRKTIAQRMLQSKQTAPEIHVTVDVRVDKLMAIREP